MTHSAAREPDHPIRVAITRASGFLGSALAARLQSDGITVHRVRRAQHVASPDIAWLPRLGMLDSSAMEGVDAIVNLAGEPIARPWTSQRKTAIRESRVVGTSLLASTIGSGEQWVSWIGLGDWLDAVRFLLASDTTVGPVNLVAPNPVPNAELATTLARVLGRPAVAHVPAAAISLFLGEMGRATLLASQRGHALRLVQDGFVFSYPTLEQSLRS